MQLHELWKFQELTDADKANATGAGTPKPRAEQTDKERTLGAFIQWLMPKWDEFYLLFSSHGTLNFQDFENFVRWKHHYSGDARHVFSYLDQDNHGYVILRTCLDLKRSYENNLDLLHQGLTGLKRLMLGKYGTLARCWRCVFDKEDTGKCCEKTFMKCCREHGFTGDVKSTWADVTGGQTQRQITLRDWDPEADTLLTAFCKLLSQRHGKLREGWGAILKHGYGKSGRLTVQEWNDICRGLGFSLKDAKILFSCLDADSSRTISHEEFLFIKRWDATEDFEKKRERAPLSQPVVRATHKPVSPATGTTKTSSPSVANAPKSSAKKPFDAWSSTEAKFDEDSPVSTAGPESGRPISQRGGTGPAAGIGAGLEFVVVLSKAEYGEYLKRRREKMISGPIASDSATAKAGTSPSQGASSPGW